MDNPAEHNPMQTVDVACDELMTDVQAFRDEWKRSHAADPGNYPASLPAGDWWDQFMMFVSTEREPKP